MQKNTTVMKRVLLFLAVLAIIAGNAFAQHEKDTISYPNWRYFYPPLDTATAGVYNNPGSFVIGAPGYEGYLQYKVLQPLTIYGIAVTPWSNGPIFCRTFCGDSRYVPDPPNVDSSALDLYAVLIQQEGDQFVRMDSSKWHQREPDRYFKYQSTYVYWDGIHEHVAPVFEFFFNNPIVVHDSFYCGFRSDYVMSPNFDTSLFIGSSWQNHYPQQWVWDYAGISNRSIGSLTQHDFETYLRTWYIEAWGRKRLGGQPLFRWNFHWGGIFPIIVPPDTHAVEGLPVVGFHRDEDFEGCPTFLWNRLEQQNLYEVAYGPADQNPDDYRSITTIFGRLVIRDTLVPTTIYAARCRARIHHVCAIHDTMVWSAWTDTIQFSLNTPDTTGTEGIKPNAGEHLGLTLLPNPASGSVTVSSAYSLERIAVYDLQGHLLIEQPAKGESATLDLGRLPKGVYMVTVVTSAGTITKQLVVE